MRKHLKEGEMHVMEQFEVFRGIIDLIASIPSGFDQVGIGGMAVDA